MTTARHLVQLLESDVLGVLPEALAAHVQTVLADQAVSVGASPAKRGSRNRVIIKVKTKVQTKIVQICVSYQ